MKLENNNRKKHLIIIEVSVITFFIVVMFYLALINYQNKINLVEPVSGASVLDRKPEFMWEGRFTHYEILVDEVSDFSSPAIKQKISDNKFESNVELGFGEYYWLVRGFDENNRLHESRIGNFFLDSVIGLELNEDDNQYSVENVGSGKEEVEIREQTNGDWQIVGSAILDVGQILKKEKSHNKTLFVAKQI
jgi:hypothetical protein